MLLQALEAVYGAEALRAGVAPALPEDIAEALVLIRNTVDYVCSLQFPSGNFPTRPQSSKDKLVQWCHGGPGVILCLAKAQEVLSPGDGKPERWLEAARKSADDVWSRGLLGKGNGLCHGVAGNGYAFLALHRVTGEQFFLYRARAFAHFCLGQADSAPKPVQRVPDYPGSLFEGSAGTACFLMDVANPAHARFPCIEF